MVKALGRSGAFRIEPAVHRDRRDRSSRNWCAETFRAFGIPFTPVRGSTSLLKRRGTVRGMHFQPQPQAGARIVRVGSGCIHGVIADLRPRSPTAGTIFSTSLDAESGTMLFIPAGMAHGFQTLEDDTVVEHLMGQSDLPDDVHGFRWNDPAMPIRWPAPITGLSAGDEAWPDLLPRMPWLGERGG